MLFFRKRLRKSTPEEDKQFCETMQSSGIKFKDKFAMVFSAYLVIVMPCLLVLVGLSLLAMFILGVL